LTGKNKNTYILLVSMEIPEKSDFVILEGHKCCLGKFAKDQDGHSYSMESRM
jgi:hypothetical protein